MKKDPKVFIEHILECIERIEEYLAGVTKNKLRKIWDKFKLYLCLKRS